MRGKLARSLLMSVSMLLSKAMVAPAQRGCLNAINAPQLHKSSLFAVLLSTILQPSIWDVAPDEQVPVVAASVLCVVYWPRGAGGRSMNLVAFALRRPITILVLVIAAVLTGGLAIDRMPRDIFPDLGVPVLYVAQPYGGMDPAQMEGFLVNYYEYHFLYITGIEHVESKSIQGAALIKLQFHPGTNMAGAMAETVSYVNRARAFMPVGTVPPFVMRFDAGSVPVGDLVFTDTTGKLSLKDMQDAALFRVRPLFATLPGVSAPPPFGGAPRTIVISADPDRLRAYNMSPDEVVAALTKGNAISPSGNVRFGNTIPMVPVNSVVSDVRGLGDVPIRSDGTRTVFIRDIGKIEDASDIETGYAIVNGHRTVYIP